MSDAKKNMWSSILIQMVVIAIVLGVLAYALIPLSKAFLSKNEVQGKTAVSQEALAMYERDVKTQEERFAKLRSESNKAELETERVKDLLKEENIRLEQAKGELAKTIDLRKGASADQMRFDNLQKELQSTNNILRLAITTMQGKIKLMKTELITVSSNVASADVSVKSQRIEENILSKKVETVKSEILSSKKELDVYKKNVADGRKEYLENEKNLRDSLVELKKKETELAQTDAELAAAEKAKGRLVLESEKLNKTISSYQSQSDLLRKQTSEEAAALKASQANLDSARAECVTYNTQLNQLEKEIEAKTKDKDKAVVEITAQSQALVEVNKKLVSAQQRLAKESESLKSIIADVDDARSEYVSYKGQFEQIKREINSRKKELSDSEKDK